MIDKQLYFNFLKHYVHIFITSHYISIEQKYTPFTQNIAGQIRRKSSTTEEILISRGFRRESTTEELLKGKNFCRTSMQV